MIPILVPRWIRVVCLLPLFFSATTTHAQSRPPTSKAADLNRYIDFSNECQHLLHELRLRFEEVNHQALNAIELQARPNWRFQLADLLQGTTLHTFLKGTCTRTSKDPEAGVDLAILYQRTRNTSSLSSLEKSRLDTHAASIWTVTLNMIASGQSLLGYLEGPVREDPQLEDLFHQLQQIASQYEDMAKEVQAFRTTVSPLRPPLPVSLVPFELLCHEGWDLLRETRQSGANLAEARSELAAAQAQCEQARIRYPRQLQELGLATPPGEEQVYDHAIEFAQLLGQRSSPAAMQEGIPAQWRRYPTPYYRYNERLLAVFNHHKYGLISYFNDMLDRSNRGFVHEAEAVPWFMVISPAQPKEDLSLQPMPLPQTAPAPTWTLEGSPKNNLVFLIDVSASMSQAEKLPLLKEQLQFLVSLFRPEDQIAVVTFSSEASVVLETTTGTFPAEIEAAIQALRSGGDTHARKGFKEAYRLAEDNFIFAGTNRVILITDGAFETDNSTEADIAAYAAKGITLNVLLLGHSESTPVAQRLGELARLGGGNYEHLRRDNAKEMIVKQARGE